MVPVPGEDGTDEVVVGVEDEAAGDDVEEAGTVVPVVETDEVVSSVASPTRDALDE